MMYWSFPEAPQDPTSDAPDPRESGPGLKYFCGDCTWTGRAVSAANHHAAHPRHRIFLRDADRWGPVKFMRPRIHNA